MIFNCIGNVSHWRCCGFFWKILKLSKVPEWYEPRGIGNVRYAEGAGWGVFLWKYLKTFSWTRMIRTSEYWPAWPKAWSATGSDMPRSWDKKISSYPRTGSPRSTATSGRKTLRQRLRWSTCECICADRWMSQNPCPEKLLIHILDGQADVLIQ